ncbi:MAG: hypothetical protein EBZ13_00795 [Planctomycetia bacterium]|nr:hypothetical protein [Planctomycetia bacterium]
MPHLPERKTFAQLAQSASVVPVYRRIFADGLTPLSAFARIDAGSDGCLFESVIGGEKVGRYSFLGAEPFLRFEARGRQVTVSRSEAFSETFESDDPLAELEQRMAAFQPARLDDLPPFTSGAIGYAAYDSVRYVEHLPDVPADDLGLPDICFAFYDRLVVFDHVSKSIDVVVLAKIEEKTPAAIAAAYDAAATRVDTTIAQLQQPSDWPPLCDIGSLQQPCGEPHANRSQQDFQQAVERAIDYIHAGDIFQVVLSRRLAVPFTASPLELYRTL